ncbi:MAG TPA: hypothetical protein VM146_01660 [Steroidobacteraceae bacterium]|nr:hypothetical protein [Steroidobacteraceae bacterium]
MSEPKKADPDEDLLEFLGGIDEVNEDSKNSDFSDFLANVDDIDKVAEKPSPGATTPAKEGKRE